MDPEETITCTSATKEVHHHHMPKIPDVQKDVDFIMEHFNDPNFDLSYPPSFASPIEEESTKNYIGEEAIDLYDESPYPEVRSAVSSIDDPLMPVNTFRMWLMGILFTLLTSGVNQVFDMRYPSIFVTGIFVQLVCLPLGQALAAILSTKRFNTFGYIWSLNPGPFSIKEHVCVTVMVNCTSGGVYSNYITLTQHVFYGQTTPMGLQILLALGSQILGFCLGGLLRQFVVWPSSMIWPAVLGNCALFNTLHKHYDKRDHHKRFFWIAVTGSFVWYWVPGYLFRGLSIFNWVCWIAPNNVIINTLFGMNTGLGMSALTFDWGIISALGNPLFTPWWSQMNVGVGFLLMFWFIAPVLYFTNVWNSAYFPIFGRFSFDNTGSPYIVKKVMTDGGFDAIKYAAYSPVFLSAVLALVYGAAFAVVPAIFMHTFLWYRQDIVHRFHNSLKDEHDIHSRLMQSYAEVPMWWYSITGIISFAFLCAAIKIIPTQLPIWGAIIGIILAFTLAVPLCMLQAITNQPIPTQVMYEVIAGYMLPGRPIANAIFKALGITSFQASIFAGDLKFGHYMKVPPRIIFTIQLVPTVISCIWVTFIQDWMLNNIEDICTPRQKQGFICPGSTVFSTASVIFGAVGPQRLFSIGAPYSVLLWFFPVGLLAPIPFYILARRYPLGIWRYINIPACLCPLVGMPTTSGIAYSSWLFCGFIFNYLIRRFRLRLWMQYNYILAVALNAGTVIAMIVIFFTLTLPKSGGIELNWWGNTVWRNTADANGIPFKSLPESGFIGPTKWS